MQFGHRRDPGAAGLLGGFAGGRRPLVACLTGLRAGPLGHAPPRRPRDDRVDAGFGHQIHGQLRPVRLRQRLDDRHMGRRPLIDLRGEDFAGDSSIVGKRNAGPGPPIPAVDEEHLVAGPQALDLDVTRLRALQGDDGAGVGQRAVEVGEENGKSHGAPVLIRRAASSAVSSCGCRRFPRPWFPACGVPGGGAPAGFCPSGGCGNARRNRARWPCRRRAACPRRGGRGASPAARGTCRRAWWAPARRRGR